MSTTSAVTGPPAPPARNKFTGTRRPAPQPPAQPPPPPPPPKSSSSSAPQSNSSGLYMHHAVRSSDWAAAAAAEAAKYQHHQIKLKSSNSFNNGYHHQHQSHHGQQSLQSYQHDPRTERIRRSTSTSATGEILQIDLGYYKQSNGRMQQQKQHQHQKLKQNEERGGQNSLQQQHFQPNHQRTVEASQGSCDTTPATPESLVGGCTSSSLVCSGEEDSGVAVSCGGASPGNNGNQSSQSATAPPSSAEANISTDHPLPPLSSPMPSMRPGSSANVSLQMGQRDNLIEEVTTPVPRLLDEAVAGEETATSVSAPSSPDEFIGVHSSASSSASSLSPIMADSAFFSNGSNNNRVIQQQPQSSSHQYFSPQCHTPGKWEGGKIQRRGKKSKREDGDSSDLMTFSNGSDSNNTGTMKRKKQHQQQQQQHCSNGQSNGIPQHQQQKVYVSLYPQMIGAMEPNYETLSRQNGRQNPHSMAVPALSSSASSSSTCSGPSSISTTRPVLDYLLHGGNRVVVNSHVTNGRIPQHQQQQPHYATIGRQSLSTFAPVPMGNGQIPSSSSRDSLSTRINNNLTNTRNYSTLHRSSHDLPLCDSVRNIANVSNGIATFDRSSRLNKSAAVVRFSSSSSNGNGNVVDDLLLLNGGANDNGVVVKDDNSTATAFPTHHTIIVPAPMDVRRDRNSRSKFLESSDEEDGSGRDAAADDNDNYSEKRGGSSRFPSLRMPRSLKKARKPPFTIEGAMNAIKKGRRTSKDCNNASAEAEDVERTSEDDEEAAEAAIPVVPTSKRLSFRNVFRRSRKQHQSPPKPTPEKVKEEIERDEETVSRLVGRKGQKGRKEREDKSGRTLQRESAAAKADDVGEGEEEEEGRRRHFQQSLSGENNNQRLGGKLPSLNGGPKSGGNNVAGLNEKAADKERAALLPSVSGGGGGGDGKDDDDRGGGDGGGDMGNGDAGKGGRRRRRRRRRRTPDGDTDDDDYDGFHGQLSGMTTDDEDGEGGGGDSDSDAEMVYCDPCYCYGKCCIDIVASIFCVSLL